MAGAGDGRQGARERYYSGDGGGDLHSSATTRARAAAGQTDNRRLRQLQRLRSVHFRRRRRRRRFRDIVPRQRLTGFLTYKTISRANVSVHDDFVRRVGRTRNSHAMDRR